VPDRAGGGAAAGPTSGTQRGRSVPAPLEIAVAAAEAADDKLGRDTLILDVGPILGLADYFVITGASNDRQVRSIVEEVENRLKARSARPRGVEGLAEAQWVLLDFGDVIVHVFHDDARAYYSLERLWGDAERVDLERVDPDTGADAGAEGTAGG